MKILVIGSGGREHALVWKIMQSSKVDKIYCAPGNAGISRLAECVDINATDVKGLLRFALQESIDLTIVGPESSLVEGVVEKLEFSREQIIESRRYHAEIRGETFDPATVTSGEIYYRIRGIGAKIEE